MADQQSSMFGQCCFDVGDMKMSLGTGGFMSVNTGTKPHQSIKGKFLHCFNVDVTSIVQFNIWIC